MNSVTNTAFISSKDIQLCPIYFDCTFFSCLFSLYIDVIVAHGTNVKSLKFKEVCILVKWSSSFSACSRLGLRVRVRFLEAGVSIQTAAASSWVVPSLCFSLSLAALAGFNHHVGQLLHFGRATHIVEDGEGLQVLWDAAGRSRCLRVQSVVQAQQCAVGGVRAA